MASIMDLYPSSLTADDVRHLARRAGFGISPEAAAALVSAYGGDAQNTVNAWVDGTGLDATVFNSALASADPVTEPGATGSNGGTDVAATPGPHPYLVGGANTWRNSLGRGQAYLAFRMQYDPFAFTQRMALFLHNLFATGWTKVDNLSLMLNQWDTFVAHGRDVFTDLLVQVSKDPAMCYWLDSVRNNAAGTRTPNENYAREVMELYSLGVDNGYSQADITNLAVGLAGWSFVVAPADVVTNPSNPDDQWVARGTFAIYDGSAATAGYKRWDLNDLGANLPNMRRLADISFLGGTFPGASPTQGEEAIRSIPTRRASGSVPPNCATFLATRLLRTFVTTQFSAQDVTDVANMIDVAGYDLRAIMKTLLASSYFYANRFALVEGPVSWAVRAARALGYALPTSGTPDASRFPAWALVSGSFENMGMKLLDPNGPNGWKEDVYWLNSNTMRYRTRFAAAVALQETYSTDLGDGNKQYTLFPTDVEGWFPTPPASPDALLSRLVDLLQPAAIPLAVQASWLDALFPSDGSGNPIFNGASWAAGNARDRQAARSLAFLVLCSPSGQLY